MIFKRLLECLEIPNIFLKFLEASECVASLYIFLYDFYKTPGVPGGPKQCSEVVEASECLTSLYIFLYDFYMTPRVPESSKQFF